MSLKKKLMCYALLTGLLTATAVPAFAHHAFAAEYDIDKPIELKGSLTKVEWINPHGWVHVDVKDGNGKAIDWAVEFGGPGALLRRGLRKSDFPLGIEVVVKGYLAKNGKNVIAATNVTLPDGRNIYAGSDNTGSQKE